MARNLTGQNSLPPRSPVGNMADDLARNARAAVPEGPAVRPTASLPPEAAAAYDASPEGRATKVQTLKDTRGYFQGNPSAAAPSAAPANTAAAGPSPASKWLGSGEDWKKAFQGAPGSPDKTLRMTAPGAPTGLGKGLLALQGAMGAKDVYNGIQEGDAVAGAALFTPAAPIAGAYLGVRGAYDTAKAAGGAIYDNLSEKARDVVGGTVNQMGLNTGLWGTDDSAKMQLDAAAPRPADTLRKTAPGAAPDPRDPYSFHQTILKRAVKEMNHGNLAPMGAFVWYIPTMIAADITKGLIQGGGELPAYMKGMDLGDHIMRATQRAGVLGIGQIGVDAGEDMFSLAGPGVEQMIDAMRDPLSETTIKALPAHGLYAQALR